MDVLVAYASKYGSTKGIAERIAAELALAGHNAEALPVTAATDLGRYDAFVIGSAVFYGKWMPDAIDFVRRNSFVLSSRPVWLFSSGPLGDPIKAGRDQRETAIPPGVAELAKVVNAREHRVFFGRLERNGLAGLDGLVARVVGVEGDFRDWADVTRWSADIARNSRATAALA